MTAALQAAIAKAILAEAKNLGKKALEDQPDVGAWLGTFADKARPDGLWDFINAGPDYLRFSRLVGEDQYEFRVPSYEGSDRGSIPKLFQNAPRKYARLHPDDFLEAYYFHDFMCSFGWCWVRKRGGAWAQMPVSKKQADVFLHMMLSAKSPTSGFSASRLEATLIYRAVRAGHAVGENLNKGSKPPTKEIP